METPTAWRDALIGLGKDAAAEYARQHPEASRDEAARAGLLYALDVFADNPRASEGLFSEAVIYAAFHTPASLPPETV